MSNYNMLNSSASRVSMSLSSDEIEYSADLRLDNDVLAANPLKVLALDDSAFTLFVRTYYHKISELELFCNK